MASAVDILTAAAAKMATGEPAPAGESDAALEDEVFALLREANAAGIAVDASLLSEAMEASASAGSAGGGRRTEDTASTGWRTSKAGGSSGGRSSVIDRFAAWLDKRNRRLTSERIKVAEERATDPECTFSPSLPSKRTYRGTIPTHAPMLDRMNEWMKHRNERIARAQRAKAADEAAACTFHPMTSPPARAAASAAATPPTPAAAAAAPAVSARQQADVEQYLWRMTVARERAAAQKAAMDNIVRGKVAFAQPRTSAPAAASPPASTSGAASLIELATGVMDSPPRELASPPPAHSTRSPAHAMPVMSSPSAGTSVHPAPQPMLFILQSAPGDPPRTVSAYMLPPSTSSSNPASYAAHDVAQLDALIEAERAQLARTLFTQHSTPAPAAVSRIVSPNTSHMHMLSPSGPVVEPPPAAARQMEPASMPPSFAVAASSSMLSPSSAASSSSSASRGTSRHALISSTPNAASEPASYSSDELRARVAVLTREIAAEAMREAQLLGLAGSGVSPPPSHARLDAQVARMSTPTIRPLTPSSRPASFVAKQQHVQSPALPTIAHGLVSRGIYNAADAAPRDLYDYMSTTAPAASGPTWTHVPLPSPAVTVTPPVVTPPAMAQAKRRPSIARPMSLAALAAAAQP